MSGARGYMTRDKESFGVLLPVSNLSMRFFVFACAASLSFFHESFDCFPN